MLGVVVVGGIYSPQPPNGRWGRLLSMGALDSPVSLSGAPLTLRTLFFTAHLSQRLLQSTVARCIHCSAGAPDSPVNYSGVRLLKPESGWFSPVRTWCTGHCPVAHRTLSGGTPDSPVRQATSHSGFFAPLN